ncbi:hypothetical protein KP78_25860 [Jeotgalibacillus soli]|uniref:Uncharacterized protein n=1 Tax=Jeotgalibacillus soli TaxID=889306 RepID=A0A0C2VKT1_9BACL|nr:hypothetical protein KP78_25860 [Jeotgalibacillus soli]
MGSHHFCCYVSFNKKIIKRTKKVLKYADLKEQKPPSK